LRLTPTYPTGTPPFARCASVLHLGRFEPPRLRDVSRGYTTVDQDGDRPHILKGPVP